MPPRAVPTPPCQYFYIRLGAQQQLVADWIEEVAETSETWADIP